MTTKFMRLGCDANLFFTNPNGVTVPIRCAAGDIARIRANYEAKGFVFVSQGACLEEVSPTGAHLPGDLEVDRVTGVTVRTLTEREG